MEAFYEEVKERGVGGIPLISTVRPATDAEISWAEAMNNQGKCPHVIVEDKEGWLYNLRHCVTCGKFLGFI